MAIITIIRENGELRVDKTEGGDTGVGKAQHCPDDRSLIPLLKHWRATQAQIDKAVRDLRESGSARIDLP